MSIEIGKRYLFNYPNFGTPDSFPDYTAHRGADVTVTRQLSDAECDPECQPMFEVRADDRWTGHADASELAEA